MRTIPKDSDREISVFMSDAMLTPPSIWVLTDGKAGDVAQCVGVAEMLGGQYETRQVAPRPPFSWWLPFGPGDPREWETKPGSPIAPPYPDVAIASGRRAVVYLRRVKHLSKGRTLTVFLKDPRIGPSAADLIWVPAHDNLRGPNVLVTLTSPHKFSSAKLEALKAENVVEIDKLPSPHIAVLIGGDSRHHTFSEDDQNRLLNGLRCTAEETGGRFLITASRRTPPALASGLASLAEAGGHLYWNGIGDNPLGHYLAKADVIIATADSTNMIGEATATGKPIHVFHPSGGHKKISRFLGDLEHSGYVHPFPGQLKTTTYEPIDATPVIAEWILAEYKTLRQSETGPSAD